MTITELLRRQHESFRRTLRAMRDSLKKDGTEGHAGLDRSLRHLLPLLAAHEEVEHDLLFPALSSSEKPVSGEVLDYFDKEHETVHHHIGELLESLQAPEARLRRLVATSDFIAVLEEHLEQEERTLFPLVEEILPLDAQERLGEAGRAQTAEAFEHAYGGTPS
ncbi:MAG: hypothetical protein CO113_08865 [Elusimicrobia bacterium CG_4_9_14_3_um_filter_62_55]|nr:MAG: hypothetical protein COR54_09730 [Elusimicrobia bacterium CG22_combo_CG10-13_8_21_14_all_63_91]PJA13463.1 MAG: hypothetical protein COX66_14680 [Elusimicrobia bacterium CG_4_10_14_0_2_um_filter_63_34]PJB25349.1 MAG: hypothetical protein CO113_08865 [Elusimicrobia bacterium CG_4_9_14_3_um_filter_62_55]